MLSTIGGWAAWKGDRTICSEKITQNVAQSILAHYITYLFVWEKDKEITFDVT
jgi:hypothetical protein